MDLQLQLSPEKKRPRLCRHLSVLRPYNFGLSERCQSQEAPSSPCSARALRLLPGSLERADGLKNPSRKSITYLLLFLPSIIFIPPVSLFHRGALPRPPISPTTPIVTFLAFGLSGVWCAYWSLTITSSKRQSNRIATFRETDTLPRPSRSRV
ncbi:hypothetical protein F5Y08DRAFT_231834 [Xylaria arbuscula]|nr:hypothetical protein F5Y08DRAFT_231834 [Xylaria arbuscula]